MVPKSRSESKSASSHDEHCPQLSRSRNFSPPCSGVSTGVRRQEPASSYSAASTHLHFADGRRSACLSRVMSAWMSVMRQLEAWSRSGQWRSCCFAISRIILPLIVLRKAIWAVDRIHNPTAMRALMRTGALLCLSRCLNVRYSHHRQKHQTGQQP